MYEYPPSFLLAGGCFSSIDRVGLARNLSTIISYYTVSIKIYVRVPPTPDARTKSRPGINYEVHKCRECDLERDFMRSP